MSKLTAVHVSKSLFNSKPFANTAPSVENKQHDPRLFERGVLSSSYSSCRNVKEACFQIIINVHTLRAEIQSLR
jgi:hypothetical protein